MKIDGVRKRLFVEDKFSILVKSSIKEYKVLYQHYKKIFNNGHNPLKIINFC